MYAPSLACSLGTTGNTSAASSQRVCSAYPHQRLLRIICQGRSWLGMRILLHGWDLSSTESGTSARVSNVTVSSIFKSSFRMSFYFSCLLTCPMSNFHLLLWCSWVVQQTIHVQGPSNIMPFKECLAAIYKLSYWVWELNIAWDST